MSLQQYTRNGGTIAVVMGAGFDAPTDWSLHPKVHWIAANSLEPKDVPGKIPTNTGVMIITDNIEPGILEDIHQERQHRHLPYVTRPDGPAVGLLLADIFPHRSKPLASDPLVEEPTPENEDPMAKKHTASQGALKEFLKEHANLSGSLSVSAEARRLMALAHKKKIPTTVASITQSLYNMKRVKSLGTRPASANPQHVEDIGSLIVAIDAAMAQLGAIKAQAERMDELMGELRKENENLNARFEMAHDMFKKISQGE
jgi:hypothetical protein